MRISLLFVLALALLSPLAAGAADETEEAAGPLYNRNGPYVGVGMNLVQELFQEKAFPGQVPDLGFDPAVGFVVHLGYRVNNWAAVDLTVQRTSDDQLGGQTATILTLLPGLRLYPLGSWHTRFHPVVLIGVGYMDAKVQNALLNEKEFGARVGGGLETYITENVVLDTSISYVAAGGDVRLLDHVSFELGVLYRF